MSKSFDYMFPLVSFMLGSSSTVVGAFVYYFYVSYKLREHTTEEIMAMLRTGLLLSGETKTYSFTAMFEPTLQNYFIIYSHNEQTDTFVETKPFRIALNEGFMRKIIQDIPKMSIIYYDPFQFGWTKKKIHLPYTWSRPKRKKAADRLYTEDTIKSTEERQEAVKFSGDIL